MFDFLHFGDQVRHFQQTLGGARLLSQVSQRLVFILPQQFIEIFEIYHPPVSASDHLVRYHESVLRQFD